jgi:hypothetical protein
MLREGVVVVGIETDRGPWVAAWVATGYRLFAINPMSVARYRERALDLGGEVRCRRCARAGRDRPTGSGPSPVGGWRQRGGGGAQAGGPGHQSLIWDRTGHLQRLRAALREYFLAAVDAFAAAKIELGDPDALELLAGRRIHGQRPGCPGRSLPR